MQFSVEKRYSSDIAFTVDIDCTEDTPRSWKLRLAILKAIELKINLSNSNLSGSDLSNSNFRGSNLSSSNFRGSNFRGSNLSSSNFRGSNLSSSNFRGSNLSNSNFHGSDLSNSNLNGAENLHYAHCPEEGSFIGWKKLANNLVAKLEIPENAKRTSSIVGRKCRAEFVKVIAIYDGKTEVSEGKSKHDMGKTIYKVGELVYPDSYDGDPRVECTNGIHFFITRKEAEGY